MGQRSAALADQFEQAVADLAKTIEACSDAKWDAVCNDEGWTVAMTCGASGERRKWPRSWVTRKLRPSNAWAAVAPRQTRTSGLTSASSCSSQGRHARISIELGLLWIRRLPRGTHLKCLTTLVT